MQGKVEISIDEEHNDKINCNCRILKKNQFILKSEEVRTKNQPNKTNKMWFWNEYDQVCSSFSNPCLDSFTVKNLL